MLQDYCNVPCTVPLPLLPDPPPRAAAQAAAEVAGVGRRTKRKETEIAEGVVPDGGREGAERTAEIAEVELLAGGLTEIAEEGCSEDCRTRTSESDAGRGGRPLRRLPKEAAGSGGKGRDCRHRGRGGGQPVQRRGRARRLHRPSR